MKGSFVPVTRKNDIVVQQLKDETLVYDLKSNKAYCLNETSALVWGLCNGKRTVSDISDEMTKATKTLIREEFVALALDQFDKDELLENGGSMEGHFGNFSRRDVIRKVGFASVIALPVISSIVAPKASMAQSSALQGFSTPCATDGQCASGSCSTFLNQCCTPGAGPLAVTGGAIAPAGATPLTCTSQLNCDNIAVTNCCSGTGTVTANGCFGGSPFGPCVCD